MKYKKRERPLPVPVLQEINSHTKTIKVYCNTKGIINFKSITDRWHERLPKYEVSFINCVTGKKIK